MNIYIFGNGNIRFDDFQKHYVKYLAEYIGNEETSYTTCDFRGVDTLVMEFLKYSSANVTIFHIGERPRYLPDKYKTKVSNWNLKGGFKDDPERDLAAIHHCTHYLAVDFNSDSGRISGTRKNIDLCQSLGKIDLTKC